MLIRGAQIGTSGVDEARGYVPVGVRSPALRVTHLSGDGDCRHRTRYSAGGPMESYQGIASVTAGVSGHDDRVESLLTEVAGEIVLAVWGGAHVDPRDVPGGPPNLHDLDVVLRDGSRIPLEVTTATNRAARQLWAAVGKRRWSLPGLRWSWSLDIRPDTRINDLYRRIGSLLGELERRGVDRFNASEPHDEPISELGRLGVRFARAVSGLQEPVVLVGSVGNAEFVDSSDVCDAVEHEAAKADNRRKLLAAGGGELFVWVDPQADNAYSALLGIVSPPRRPPRLPDGITGVWAARYIVRPGGRPGAAVVLRGDPMAGWSDVTKGAGTG